MTKMLKGYQIWENITDFNLDYEPSIVFADTAVKAIKSHFGNKNIKIKRGNDFDSNLQCVPVYQEENGMIIRTGKRRITWHNITTLGEK